MHDAVHEPKANHIVGFYDRLSPPCAPVRGDRVKCSWTELAWLDGAGAAGHGHNLR